VSLAPSAEPPHKTNLVHSDACRRKRFTKFCTLHVNYNVETAIFIYSIYLYTGVYVLIRTNYINAEKYEILKWHKGGVWVAGVPSPSD